MKDYRNTSGGIHKQAESHHEWSVIMVEHLFPGKKATARFIMLEGNYHDWAAQDADTSPPMAVFNEDEDITIVDHNDCTCALKDEILKVTFNSDVGAFIPVGSSGLVRQAIVDDTIDYGDSGDVFLARCGTQITPTATVTAHNCHNDSESDVAAGSKVVIAYIQGFTDNTVYRQGAWQIINSPPSQDSSGCNQIPGVDLDALETVSAELVDFVLAVKDGCLVKVAVSDCAGSGSV